ncbi:unnamed protein product [Amoebophrya sp. A25]|nr:unnamed protein product [Amoebophrya sp. A25]|eukprot:GSA25T00008904001.1
MEDGVILSSSATVIGASSGHGFRHQSSALHQHDAFASHVLSTTTTCADTTADAINLSTVMSPISRQSSRLSPVRHRVPTVEGEGSATCPASALRETPGGRDLKQSPEGRGTTGRLMAVEVDVDQVKTRLVKDHVLEPPDVVPSAVGFASGTRTAPEEVVVAFDDKFPKSFSPSTAERTSTSGNKVALEDQINIEDEEADEEEVSYTLSAARRTVVFWIFTLTMAMVGSLNAALMIHMGAVFKNFKPYLSYFYLGMAAGGGVGSVVASSAVQRRISWEVERRRRVKKNERQTTRRTSSEEQLNKVDGEAGTTNRRTDEEGVKFNAEEAGTMSATKPAGMSCVQVAALVNFAMIACFLSTALGLWLFFDRETEEHSESLHVVVGEERADDSTFHVASQESTGVPSDTRSGSDDTRSLLSQSLLSQKGAALMELLADGPLVGSGGSMSSDNSTRDTIFKNGIHTISHTAGALNLISRGRGLFGGRDGDEERETTSSRGAASAATASRAHAPSSPTSHDFHGTSTATTEEHRQASATTPATKRVTTPTEEQPGTTKFLHGAWVFSTGVMQGASTGLNNILQTTGHAVAFGRRHNGAIQGFAKSIMVVGSATGPILLTSLHRFFRTHFVLSLVVLSVWPLVLGVLSVWWEAKSIDGDSRREARRVAPVKSATAKE